jgi:DNA-binding NtrC family response regulator
MGADKVLLIDDEVDFVETLAERLQGRGLEVDTALTGDEGVEKAKGKAYDAVILDLAMPGMDGIETLKVLLGDNPDLQVMLLTGQATIKTAVEATRLGAVDILEKPTDVETLMERIRTARARYLALREKRDRDNVEDILKKYGW